MVSASFPVRRLYWRASIPQERTNSVGDEDKLIEEATRMNSSEVLKVLKKCWRFVTWHRWCACNNMFWKDFMSLFLIINWLRVFNTAHIFHTEEHVSGLTAWAPRRSVGHLHTLNLVVTGEEKKKEKKKPKCHHLLSVWTEYNVTYAHTVTSNWTEQKPQACVRMCTCVRVCKVRGWGGRGGYPINSWTKALQCCCGFPGGGIWVSSWNRESQSEAEDDQLFSAAYPCQQISLHQPFLLLFLKTTQINGM